MQINRFQHLCCLSGSINKISLAGSPSPLLTTLYNHNGIKLRMGYGGPPSSAIVKEVESYIKPHTEISIEKCPLKTDSPVSDYVNRIRSMLDWKYLAAKKLKVLVDPMYGTTAGFLEKILDLPESKITTEEIHSDPDPYFGGFSPEPKEETTA